MKKIISITIMLFFFIMPITVFAEGTTVEVKISGQVKSGENIEIYVDVKGVQKLYATSVDFIYDTELLKVNSISSTEFINKYSSDIMELGGETNKNGNTAAYSFTFLGDKEGISGSGTLVTINATVIKDGILEITEENMKIKLVKRSEDTVKDYDYKFIGYNSNTSNSNISGENSNTNSSKDNSKNNIDFGNDKSQNSSNGISSNTDNSTNNNSNKAESDSDIIDGNEESNNVSDENDNKLEASDNSSEQLNEKENNKNNEIKNINLLSNKKEKVTLYGIVFLLVIGVISISGYYIYKRVKKK